MPARLKRRERQGSGPGMPPRIREGGGGVTGGVCPAVDYCRVLRGKADLGPRSAFPVCFSPDFVQPSGGDVRFRGSHGNGGRRARGTRGGGCLAFGTCGGRVGTGVSDPHLLAAPLSPRAPPPSARGAGDPRGRPPERPVRCGCGSEASTKRSLGAVRNEPSGAGPSPSPRPWRIVRLGSRQRR